MGRALRHSGFDDAMTDRIGVHELTLMFKGAGAQIRERHRRLSELDCAAGDVITAQRCYAWSSSWRSCA